MGQGRKRKANKGKDRAGGSSDEAEEAFAGTLLRCLLEHAGRCVAGVSSHRKGRARGMRGPERKVGASIECLPAMSNTCLRILCITREDALGATSQ